MAETTDDVRREIELTRERMSETVAQIDAHVSDRVRAVKERLDVTGWVREHPWVALAIAVGAGVAVGASGADRAAAGAAVSGARSAAGATKDAAVGAADAVRERFAGSDDEQDVAAEGSEAPAEGGSIFSRLAGRVMDGVAEALRPRVDELVAELRGANDRVVETATRTMEPRRAVDPVENPLSAGVGA